MDREQRLRMALRSDAERIRVRPELRQRIDAQLRPTRMRARRAALALGMTVVVVAVVLVTFLLRDGEDVREVVSSPAPAEEAIGLSERSEAEEALKCFFYARKLRDFKGAQPCATRNYIAKTDLQTFIGASSPTVGRVTILRDDIRSYDRIDFVVRVYWGSSSGLDFYSDDRVAVVRDGDRWGVDSWNGDPDPSHTTDVGDSTLVWLHFLALGDTPSCDAGGDVTAESFAPLRRMVPQESTTKDLVLSVVRELFTGPWSDEGDAAGAFPAGSRVLDVRVDRGLAHVTVSSETFRAGSSCGVALSRAALERTVLAVPGIDDVKIVGGT